jgi:hypothetical protein
MHYLPYIHTNTFTLVHLDFIWNETYILVFYFNIISH